MVQPCEHFTSSAKISNCGFVYTVDLSPISILLFCGKAFVFWASSRTKILPLNTAGDSSCGIFLYHSYDSQCGFIWSTMVWLSTDCLSAVRLIPYRCDSPCSASKRTLMLCRTKDAPGKLQL